MASNARLLDGLTLSRLLPAPLIIFSTFAGYLGDGPWGAVVTAAGIFLPTFAFTLLEHDALESLAHHPRIRLFLEGVTAGVDRPDCRDDAGAAASEPDRGQPRYV
ncbi:chromate transporter [Stenotrophomonas acidaminiphila]|uniref:chromate transporter n=1 Tax=Stenotrophomonas acidaminiphila TaxID=128780 RepID=UPI00240600C3|nr:chromate transporter [Stenotrophomonas acidaminiphila]